MPVGVEQWRAAVGAMARSSAPKPRSPIGPHWKKWLKASDPVAYKGCVFLLVTIAQLVRSGLEQAQEKTEEMVKEGSERVCQSASRGKKEGERALAMRARPSVVLATSLMSQLVILLCGHILQLQYHGAESGEWCPIPTSEKAIGSDCVWTKVFCSLIILLPPLTQLSLSAKQKWYQNNCKPLSGKGDLNKILETVKESVSVCLCQALLYLGQSLLLLKRFCHYWARLVSMKCSKKTVAECVGSLTSLLFPKKKRLGLSEVTMIVFVNQMLLMIAGDVERNPGPDTLAPEDLATLVTELYEVRAKWYDLGVQLRMTTPDLDAIQTQYQNNPDNPGACLRQMLSDWLTKEVSSPPTWQRVVGALSAPTVHRPAVAQRVRQTYLSQDPATDPVGKQRFLTTEEIESRMEELENEFEALKDDVYESIKTQPVDVFKVKLTSFKIRDKECHMDYMNKVIRKKMTVTDIWVKLNKYFNFLNHTILQHILTKFKNRDLQIRMNGYSDKLYCFFKQTRLCDFVQCWPMTQQDPPAKELKEFVVKSHKEWETCTLADLDNLKGKLATKLLLPNFALFLTKASKGCLEMTFSIPPSLVEYLRNVVRETELREFADMEIETITVDGVVCYEAPLLQYTTLLKQLYTSRSPLQPLPDSKPKPLLPFRLARIEKQSLSPSDMDKFTRESLRGDMDNMVYKKTAMELSQLEVMGDGSRPQVVLIEGAPGVGKTTFAWHQCRQWAEGKLLQAYSIVLLLPLRDSNIRQISSLPGLFRHSRGQVREEVSRRVAESGGAGCLIWLEAWDELPGDLRSDSLFTELIRGIQLPAATIFITSLPWAARDLLETVGDRLSQHKELLALAKEEVQNEITVMIDSQTSSDSGFNFSEFIESNPMIRAAMYTPLSAAIVEQVFKSSPHNPPTTVTGLYSAYVLLKLEQHLSEHPEYSCMNINVRTLADLPERVLRDFQRLCGLAYEGVSQQIIAFSSIPEEMSTFGLVQRVSQIYDEGVQKQSYVFLHYTIQEYLAAFHLSHQPPQEVMNIIIPTRFNRTLHFLAGITELKNFPAYFKDIPTMCRLLCESQNQALLIALLGSGKRRLSLSYSATITDYVVAGYCLAHSKSTWNIDFSSVDDTALEFFSKGCRHRVPHTAISSEMIFVAFSHGSVTHRGLAHFMNIPYPLLKNIRTLIFSHNNLNKEGCDLLAKGFQMMPCIDSLDVSYNRSIGCGGVVHLVLSLQRSKLRQLDMTRTGIEDPDFEYLSRYVHSTKSLEQLKIAENKMSVKSMCFLCKALCANSSVWELDISGCQLTTQHSVYLKQLLKYPAKCGLEKLVIMDCSLTRDEVGEIMSGLNRNHTLRELNLSHNQVDFGVIDTARMLKINKSMVGLDLGWCGIGSSGGVELGAALESNNTLKYLRLSGNALGDDGVRGLYVGLENNTSLTELWLACDMEQVSEDVLARKRPDLKLHNKIPETWPLYSPVGTAMKGQVQSFLEKISFVWNFTFLLLLRLLSEVSAPEKKVLLGEKLIWTAVILFIYQWCSHIPLLGIMSSNSADPYYWHRTVNASSQGTLMELGVSPIATYYLLGYFNIMERKPHKKLLCMVVTLCQSVYCLMSGMYGTPSELGIFTSLIIILQLCGAGLMVMMLNELLEKYGMGSSDIFIVTNICGTVFWKAFSPVTINTDGGREFEGVIIAFLHMLASHSDKFQALYKVLFRHNLPNLLNLTATVLVFATVIYLQGFRVELPIKSARYRGQCSKYSIKLLYTGITPVIIHRVLVLYLYQASQIFYLIFGGNLLVDLLGVWSTVEDTQPSRLFFLEYRSGYYPSSGLCYYLSAIGSHPGSVIIDEPIRAIIYGTFMLCTCAFISRISINMSGTSADNVAKQLMDKQNMVLRGHQNLHKSLNQYIPTAATLGGLCIGALCVFADIFGAFDSGANLIITITFIYTFYEQIVKEQQEQSHNLY